MLLTSDVNKESTFPLNLNEPIYNIHKTYLENAEEGPFFTFELPKRKLPSKTLNFLDHPIYSLIGIPAGPLLNSKWIKFASEMGFDVLCYKTIRSSENFGHPLPNMIYVDCPKQLNIRNLPKSLTAFSSIPTNMHEIAVTNSFGMPSRSQEYLAEDISKAYTFLKPNQIMIVSIVGSSKNSNAEELINDFVLVAKQAKEYGAKVIEANFSCPNASKQQGEIYKDPIFSYKLAKEIVKAIHPIPLIIKMGVFENINEMEEVLISLAKAGVRAICGINTISMKVVNASGDFALGIQRPTSGICGAPIRNAALEFVSQASLINKKHHLNFEIMGTGGIIESKHFNEFINNGAQIAMTATGMIWDPFIAMRYHHKEQHEY